MTHLILEETKKEKERQLAEKDAIIADQARKMEHMALEFADMLKVTLQLFNWNNVIAPAVVTKYILQTVVADI